jgi:hypothetical protein
MSVSKTFSLPFDLLKDVENESEIMGKTFSETVQTLLSIALSLRRDSRQSLLEEEEKLLKRGG